MVGRLYLHAAAARRPLPENATGAMTGGSARKSGYAISERPSEAANRVNECANWEGDTVHGKGSNFGHVVVHIPAHRDRPFRLNVNRCSGLT